MSRHRIGGTAGRMVRQLAGGLLIAVAVFAGSARGASPELDSERLKIGERIYRNGILEDGSILRGKVQGDVEIDSSMFSCVNCHARSGLGTVEGQIVSPAVNGPSLYKPRYLPKDEIKNEASRRKGVARSVPPLRPAYDDQTLADAIRGGADPNGRSFLPVMPRYDLDDAQMAILIDYLKHLSATYSPGVDDRSIRFATIVTDDVSPQDRQALLASLDTLVTINRQYKTQRLDRRFFKMVRMPDATFYKEISIATWELTGDQTTWQKQLEDYYRKEPVFAILGGISNRPWQPVHEFCEVNRIPCLFPITDLPVVTTKDWYTIYASEGYYQEGETAARYLTGLEPGISPGSMLQIVRDTPEGQALAKGFSAGLVEKGYPAADTVVIPADAKLDAALLRQSSDRPYGAVMIWSGPEAVKTLAGMKREELQSRIVLSYRYLGDCMKQIPDDLRRNVLLTYPYRLPGTDESFRKNAETFTLGKLKEPDTKRIVSRAFSMIHLLLMGLKEMKYNYYRDNLLDSLSMFEDQYLPDFLRYSFGPGQRYASKGCYMVQLGEGNDPKLIPKSDWVIF